MSDDRYVSSERQQNTSDDSDSDSDSDSDLDESGIDTFRAGLRLLSFPDTAMPDDGMANIGMNEPFTSESDEDVEEPLAHIPLPESLTALQKELQGDYTCPRNPLDNGPILHKLTPCQELSLRHYVAWKESNGTVKAFQLHAHVLQQATGHEILSLYKCHQLMVQLTGLKACKVDICPNSCVAYTGQFKDMRTCPFV
jgi:hypothetical protein